MLMLSFQMFLQVFGNDVAGISKWMLGVILSVAANKHDYLISSYVL